MIRRDRTVVGLSGIAQPTPVLFVNHTARQSGAEMSLLSLVERLPSLGFQPLVVVPEEGRFAATLRRAGVPVEVIGLAPAPWYRPRAILASSAALRRAVRRHGAKLIHANSIHAIKIAVPYSRLSGVPLIGSVRDIIPLTFLTRAAILACDRVLCVSQATANHVNRGSTGHGESRVRVVYNGVSISRHASHRRNDDTRQRVGLAGLRPPLVGVVAPLVPWKGQSHFLEAARIVAARSTAGSFVIVGDSAFSGPEYEAQLRVLASVPELQGRVSFLGFREDIPDVLAALDVLVCPSIQPDPLPRALLEAMAAGLPVIAAAHGGIPEVVIDGSTGFLYLPRDPRELATRITELVANEPLRLQLGAAALEVVRGRFSVDGHVAQVVEEYRRVLAAAE